MKTILKEYGLRVVIVVVFIALIGALYYLYNQNSIKNAKIDLQQREAIENAIDPDEREMVEYKRNIEANDTTLEKIREEISERLKQEDRIERVNECYNNQIDRMQRGESTDPNYCFEMLDLEERWEYNDRVDAAKSNCYEQGMPENMCENPYHLNKFEDPVEEKVEEIYPEDFGSEDPYAGYSAYRHEWVDERNEWISYMYDKSVFNKDMILTFLSENDSMGLNRPSIETGFDGQRAYGICQLYYRYHKPFIDSEEFNDPYKQMDYCMWVWDDAEKRGILPTTFQAYPFRSNASKKLVFVK